MRMNTLNIYNSKFKSKAIFIAIVFLQALFLSAKPVSKIKVLKVCKAWLQLNGRTLGEHFNKKVNSIKVFKDERQNNIFFAINLEPKGFIILSADNMINPVIAFSDHGKFSKNTNSPLYSLLDGDMKDRILNVKKIENSLNQNHIEMSSIAKQMKNKRKWEQLESYSGKEQLDAGLDNIDDIRVAPLTKTKWSQQTVNSSAYYNYYTPGGTDGNGEIVWNEGDVDNYPTGCVATATAQLLRYFKYPNSTLDTSKSYTIKCDDVKANKHLKGGDGNGSPYVWNDMPEVPSSSSLQQQKAIGALLFDCGLSVNMSYHSNGSAANSADIANALLDSFDYSNAIYALDTKVKDDQMLNHIMEMVNPNLDAGLPVIFGLKRPPNYGHAVICDGYGYTSGTIYHHLNLGWSGASNAWYNLPNVDANANKIYNRLTVAVYNIFINNTGEIISGRVLDSSGQPLEGITVSADNTTATTNKKGIYALMGMPSKTSVTVSCAGANDIQVNTGLSKSGFGSSYSVGNVWNANFTISNQQDKYTLTIKKGSGTGQYAENSVVDIAADYFLGLVFDSWTGDIQYVDDVNANDTTVTMPPQNITITATYKDATANTFSISGTVSGAIQSGVTITCDSGESTVTDASGNYQIDNLAASTYILTPTLNGYSFTPSEKSVAIATSDITGIDFTSNQNNTTLYSLTVKNGTGSGQYAQGTIVQITANIPNGKEFDIWIGDNQYINDLTNPTTNFVMPAKNLSIEPSFKDAPVGTYSISGKITGDIISGVNIHIDATHSTVSTATGDYTITGLINGTYTVTPTISGYNSSPTNQSVTINSSNIADVNFTTTAIPTSKYQKITYGSIISVIRSQVPQLPSNVQFDKLPKIYAEIAGRSLGLKKDKNSSSKKIMGIWKKKYSLNGKLKKDFAATINKKNQNKFVQIIIKGKIDGKKTEYKAQQVLLVPPEITSFDPQNDHIEFNGLFFGAKPPKVFLEPFSGGKLIKGKVDKKSYYFDPSTGQSFLKATFNLKKLSNYKNENLWVIIDNKIGIGVQYKNNVPEMPFVYLK